MKILPILLKDFYKTDHRRQYPEGSNMVYSNITARGSRIPEIQKIVVFGIQYFVKEYLINKFNEEFFSQPKEKVVAEYKRRMDTALGPNAFPLEHLEALHDLGYLPIKIKALPEGSLCDLRVPFATIRSTNDKFFWLTNFLETLISMETWGPITSATISHEYRKILSSYAEKTSDIQDFVMWQGHDFSMRGMYGVEASVMSGMAHLLNFYGTDTIPAIDGLEQYYNANAEKELIGGSVPATEHSVMCMGGFMDEIETYRRLITKTYPKGIVSIVSDTWDYFGVLTSFLPALKADIMARDGKVVIRPDSGDPVDIICGLEDVVGEDRTPEQKGSIEVLWEIFGGTVNSKGYKQLDSHIGLIYGDSITMNRCREICRRLEKKGFASTNLVLGIGSYTYQYNTRDTFGIAVKSTYGEIFQAPIELFKKPKTDDGLKNSAKGLLKVNEDGSLSEEVSWEEEGQGLLETVFEDGKLIKDQSLAEIRARINENLKKCTTKTITG